jgi:hypothetical protein
MIHRRFTDLFRTSSKNAFSVYSKSAAESSSAKELKIKSNELLLNKFSILGNGKKAMKSINESGFKINDISIKGPAILLNSELFLWDVPQYGVGGPSGDVEPLESDAWPETSSPFYGWTDKMLKIFEIIDQKPEMLVIGTVGERNN